MAWLTSDESVARYRDALRRAALEDETFARFRRESGVREIVEGVPDVVGHGYYAKLLAELGPERLAGDWNSFVKNDLVGAPQLVDLPSGLAASTTMRYAWNVVDMRRNGVELDGKHVVEVGGGYGGLCRMVHEFHSPASYTIVDLPEAISLARRYLDAFGLLNEAKIYTMDARWDKIPVDTFISNYALTELSRDVQRPYVDALMKRATYGYVTHNSQPRNADNQYSLDELRASVLGHAEVQEENVKRSECRVLVWRPE